MKSPAAIARAQQVNAFRAWNARIQDAIDDYWLCPIRACLVGGCLNVSRSNRRGYCAGHQMGSA